METPVGSTFGNKISKDGKIGGPEIGTGCRSSARLELSGLTADGMRMMNRG
jgi:hypothetical protein